MLTSYRSRAGINGVGTGFYHLPLEVEFTRAPNPPRGCSQTTNRLWDLLSRAEAYASVSFLFVGFLLLYRHMWQPRGSAPKGWYDVMAVMIGFSAMARDVSRAE